MHNNNQRHKAAAHSSKTSCACHHKPDDWMCEKMPQTAQILHRSCSQKVLTRFWHRNSNFLGSCFENFTISRLLTGRRVTCRCAVTLFQGDDEASLPAEGPNMHTKANEALPLYDLYELRRCMRQQDSVMTCGLKGFTHLFLSL